MENFTPSKQYVSLFNEAKRIKNIDQMEQLFKELCGECGISDPASDASQAAAGKAIAEHMNNLGKGTECKKI